ncbi:MAG TPA: M20/M25/M40 family metallo-hydrolase [Candidatus Limnocylindrales bacterium]|nr:M20/M25/M40 family metallo-hydrolase [Candidatus Limnocylindrales bacterium]
MSRVAPASSGALPSRSWGRDDWSRTADEAVAILRDLIRIPSVNPPDPDRPDGELRAAHAIADVLADAGLAPEVLEPVSGRGSVVARLRGDGTGGDPILLLSHLDVVPAPAEGWTHDPFAADLVAGYVWGRGAVDMKARVAMELAIVRLLAAETRAAGRDPASDPVPDLTRDVLFASTADEEAGGRAGAWWIADHRPELLRAAGALNECGGVSVDVGGRRLYPIGVAEKGFAIFRIVVAGTAGHGSMPRDDNAAVLAAEVVRRLAVPGPIRPPAVMRRALPSVASAVPGPAAVALRRIAADDEPDADAAIAGACDPTTARALRAVLRDTVSPNVVRAGVKYNVIPGRAEIEVDCRTLPGTDGEAMAAELRRRIGDDLLPVCTLELVIERPPVEAPAEGRLYDLLAATLRDHDPDAVPVPVMVPFATDAKSTIPLGTPTYGFSPLRLDPGERFLDRFHGVDERVAVDAIAFGLPVLYDVVRRFCA